MQTIFSINGGQEHQFNSLKEVVLELETTFYQI